MDGSDRHRYGIGQPERLDGRKRWGAIVHAISELSAIVITPAPHSSVNFYRAGVKASGRNGNDIGYAGCDRRIWRRSKNPVITELPDKILARTTH
jgi:hypothetical protein